MANFLGLVYATLKNEGIDTSNMSSDEAVKKFNELKKGGDGTPAEQKEMEKRGIGFKSEKAISLMKSGKTPNNIEMKEFMGGTMDINGNPIDMTKFKDGYLVSCMNDSFEENRDYIYKNAEFIDKFLKYSDDGELYVGSWFENNSNNNEPTIWVKDKDKAIELAKKTGQYAITDCKAYNKFGCKNYELMNESQMQNLSNIFIDVSNDKEHKIKLSEVRW